MECRRLAAGFLVLLLANSVPGQHEHTNLLANAGFEEWPGKDGPPAGWAFLMGQSPSVFLRDTQDKHSGAASLRYELGGENNTGWLGQRVRGIHPDTEYRWSGYLKVAQGAKIPLRLNVEPNLGGCELQPSADWARWEWTFNSREAETAVVQFRFRGSGTVWVDDVHLVRVGEPGAKVLPERADLLRLLAYQSNRADPDTNTDTWTRPLCRDKRAGTTFPLAPDPVVPEWGVGQWVRYLCRDSLLVPSQKPEKRPQIALIDCAIVGEEILAGKRYCWYQSVVRLDKYWVAEARGRYDSGEKLLLARERKAVLSFLVNGPDFSDVRRYQLKIDDEPLLEYTEGAGAALPRLDISHALIRPSGEGGTGDEVHHSRAVPVTGVVSFVKSAAHLDRTAEVVNWGQTGAVDERRGERPFPIELASPPYIAVAFDGFGTVDQVAEMVAAGANLIQNQVGLYLGEVRPFYNRLPAHYFNARAWDVDMFDLCRSNFIGFAPHLDEPYQRQRKPNEYIKRGQAGTLPEAAESYTSALRRLLDRMQFWPGHEMHSYDSPAAAAWYDARAGAGGFVLENARLTSELAAVARVTGRKGARALVDEINIACLAGAAGRFGIWWGQGIYCWVPQRYWRDELITYARNGARYLGFWITLTRHKDDELAFYKQVRAALPDLAREVRAVQVIEREPAAAIVVPFGYVVAMPGSVPARPWGILDDPGGQDVTDSVIRKAAEFYDQGVAFDIVVDDPGFPPALSRYGTVVKIP